MRVTQKDASGNIIYSFTMEMLEEDAIFRAEHDAIREILIERAGQAAVIREGTMNVLDAHPDLFARFCVAARSALQP